MPSKTPIIAWARSPVAPLGSALAQLSPHELGRPLLLSLLQQSGLPAHAVDAVVIGNALGAGGNPARMLALGLLRRVLDQWAWRRRADSWASRA